MRSYKSNHPKKYEMGKLHQLMQEHLIWCSCLPISVLAGSYLEATGNYCQQELVSNAILVSKLVYYLCYKAASPELVNWLWLISNYRLVS